MHLGIDYGSKLAGTTAICYQQDSKFIWLQSEKKKDADKFILQVVENLKPTDIFIDAPLSLPAAYFGKGEDYFYRKCDRELNAMSPMFLGGLTARAMKLAAELRKRNINCFESYPAGLVTQVEGLKKNYNKKSAVNKVFRHKLSVITGFSINNATNWHQVDALLCWWTGKRYIDGVVKILGDKSEGQIRV